MTKERRLGRGLEALLGKPIDAIGDAPAPQSAETPGEATHSAADVDGLIDDLVDADVGTTDPPTGFSEVNVYEIDPNPYQPRQTFDEQEVESLAASIQQHGLLQPVVVREHGERYQLISGERRLRAAIKSGWTTVPAKVVEVEDREVAELAIVENLQRKDLNPLEKAVSFDRYLERYNCTQDELATRLNIDRSTIANLIRLLELPEAVQEALRAGQITQGHARALLPLGDEGDQCHVCDQIQHEALSVRATESVVQALIFAADAEPLSVVGGETDDEPQRQVRSDQLSLLEQEFRVALGTKVELRQTARGRGKIMVYFKNNDEFQRIHQLLCSPGGQELPRQVG